MTSCTPSHVTQVVSTDHAGMVCVWHVSTGRLRFCYGNTHGGSRISAATFDRNYRRLITGRSLYIGAELKCVDGLYERFSYVTDCRLSCRL